MAQSWPWGSQIVKKNCLGMATLEFILVTKSVAHVLGKSNIILPLKSLLFNNQYNYVPVIQTLATVMFFRWQMIKPDIPTIENLITEL